MAKQSKLLLHPTKVELGVQVGVEFDNITIFQLGSRKRRKKGSVFSQTFKSREMKLLPLCLSDMVDMLRNGLGWIQISCLQMLELIEKHFILAAKKEILSKIIQTV